MHSLIDNFGDKTITSIHHIVGKAFIFLAFAFISALLYSYTQPNNAEPATSERSPLPASNTPSTSLAPTPTPFPFQELTIPYLRSRIYESSLGELSQIQQSTSYTTYLTSYDSDGLRINGLLYVPTDNSPSDGWPAVVFVHGYIPPAEYETLENYNSYASSLASRGLVVFKIDLRGHNESEGEASGAYYSGDYIIDTLNAHSALQNFDQVNASQIGLWGHSMAGNVVFRALAAKPNIPRVVIWAGAVYTYEDFQEFRIQDNSYQAPPQESERRRLRDELFSTYGEFDPVSVFWSQVPATNYLEEITGSIQIHHAIDDNVVNVEYSKNLISILDNTSIPHELFEYGSGGHNLTGTTFSSAIDRSASFLTSY